MKITLEPGRLTLSQLRSIARDQAVVQLDLAACPGVVESSDTVRRIVGDGKTVYGVNTGFGRLAQTSIPRDQLEELQTNLVLSHSVGMGPLLSRNTTRLVLALKAASLARGHSGIRPEIIGALLQLLERDVLPCIPSKGSVGASGDLAPLAHMSSVLLGVGETWLDGERVAATEGLAAAGLEPVQLGPKEGLALLNGTQVSTALALEGLFAAEDAFAGAVVAGALSVDAARGSHNAFDARIQSVRGQPGQIAVAQVYRELLAGSEIRESHVDCDRVQDPYSLRCQPQVMGACLDHLRFASEVLEREANAVSDNPLVFADEGVVLSGGNFHAQPVAMASDVIALAISEIGALSERRIALLMDKSISGLPPFLATGPTESGFMIAQVTAAALASENKSLAHPASVDSLPTSANQEDHVSMATYAARRLGDMADNTSGILGIEMLAAVRGIELLAPLRTSDRLAAIQDELRKRVPLQAGDHYLAPELESAKKWIQSGKLNAETAALLFSVES